MFGKTNYWPHINELISRVRKLETENKAQAKELQQLCDEVRALRREVVSNRRVLSAVRIRLASEDEVRKTFPELGSPLPQLPLDFC